MPARSRTKAKKNVAPILVSIGRNAATIYPRPAERGRGPRWMLADYSTGKRRFQTFDTEREARDEAARLVARLNAMDADGASMTGAERRDLVRATELVAPFNLDVPTACALFAEAAALVGHDVVVTACKAFAKRSPNARKPLPLRQAVEDLLESKDSKGRSPRLLGDIRSRLGRFVNDHPGRALGDFSTADLQTWIDGLKGAHGTPLAAQTKRNFATLLHALFEHSRRRGSIADNPVKDLEREQVKRREDVAFWTPDEARARPRAQLHALSMSPAPMKRRAGFPTRRFSPHRPQHRDAPPTAQAGPPLGPRPSPGAASCPAAGDGGVPMATSLRPR